METTLLFPTAAEAAPFAKRYGSQCRIVVCGIGPVECAAAAAAELFDGRPDLLILAGTAGAYHNSGLQPGDVVEACSENFADLGTMRGPAFLPLPSAGSRAGNSYANPRPLPGLLPQVEANTVATAGDPHLNALHRGAAIENMEGAAFFAVCLRAGIRFAEVRAVSNFVGAPPSEWILPEASSHLADSLAAIIDTLQKP